MPRPEWIRWSTAQAIAAMLVAAGMAMTLPATASEPPEPRPAEPSDAAAQEPPDPDPEDQPTRRIMQPAQRRGPGVQEPPLSQALSRLIEADHLTEAERTELRIFHGLWRDGDLATPQQQARAALVAGAAGHPSLTDPQTPALDRAEGALLRGRPEESLKLAPAQGGPRSTRIRAEALAMLGRYPEALAEAQPVIDALTARELKNAPDIVDAVRLLALRTRLAGAREGAGAGGQQDFQGMMATLADVRDRIDRLYWPAVLTEAELLLEKDNPAEAQKALMQVLSLNPSCARAWRLLGDMAVLSFDFSTAEQMAARLDMLAARAPAGDGGRTDESTNPWGGIIRARVSLRLMDPDAASDVLEPVLRAYPAHREARAIQAAAQALRFDFQAADQAARDFDALSPGAPEALYEIGRALSEARQYEQAADFLRRAHERLPHWPAPVIDLGLLEMQSGRDQEALEALKRAHELDPFNVRADNSLRLARELASYATIESEHFIVRYRPGPRGPESGPDAALAREMLPVLEEIHEIVAGDGHGGIDHQPARKTIIELMPDHRWFAVRIAGMPRIHTIAASTGPVIAMEVPREGARHQGTYDWARVVKHEYVHTVTLSRTSNRIPHWFTEAAAVYLEQAPRDYSTARLLANALRTGSLFDFTKINISFVRPEKPSDRAQAYAQGHWMYEYMVQRFGDQAPLKLMDQYAQGIREESAFQQVLGVTREAFMREFQLWARQQVIAWGLLPPDGVPDVRELQRLETERQRAGRGEEGAEKNAVGGGQVPITIELVDRWLADYPEHPDLLELAVDLRLKDNSGQPTPDMAPLLERYAAARPVDPMPHRQLARLYLAGSVPGAGPEAAIPHLEYLDQREQKSPAYAAALARRHAAMDNWPAATESAERATMIAPYSAEMRELAATIALQQQDHPTAARHLAALVEIEPDRPLHRQRLEALERLRAGAAGAR